MRRCALSAFTAILMLNAVLPTRGAAQRAVTGRPKSDDPWDISVINSEPVKLDVTVDEGTWMSVDVSPDGRTILFDILGDLFTVPISGGEARLLVGGVPFDHTARYSPDGRHILFVSDRDGSDQLWMVDADGSNPKQITKDPANHYGSPAWLADGRFVLARRAANAGGMGFRGLSMLHVDGGSGLSLPDSASGSGPVASPDGRWVYVSRGGAFRGEGAQISRYDRLKGESETVTAAVGNALRPILSRDGKTLAYVRQSDGVASLVVRDLETGNERDLYAGLDELTPWPKEDTDFHPGYAFTPDDRAIVFAASGKLRRVDLATGQADVIAFTARLQQTYTDNGYVRSRITETPFSPRALSWAHPTPDGRWIVFGAIGKVFRHEVASGTVRPLAEGPGFQFAPAVSPDGNWIAYVAWQDSTVGNVYRTRLDGGKPERLTARGGHYESVSWSPDGQRLATVRTLRGPDDFRPTATEIGWLDANRMGPLHVVAKASPRRNRHHASRATFNVTGDRILYDAEGEFSVSGDQISASSELLSVTLDGTDKRTVATVEHADEIVPSPDGRWIAFGFREDVYLAAVPSLVGPKPIQLRSSDAGVPVYPLSKEGGQFLTWLEGGRRIAWSWGPNMWTADVADYGPEKEPQPRKVEITFQVPRANVAGTVALQGARIVTMKGDEVIERGDLLIEGGRIKAIGKSGSVAIPSGTRTFDLKGKTVIPGFVDVHAHLKGAVETDLVPEWHWELVASLAYGTTTWRDPSARPQKIFQLAEMVEAGRIVGPRIYSTGSIFFYDDWSCCGQARSLDDARRIVRRQKAMGATWVKEHTSPKRTQHQWIVQAAREEGMMTASDVSSGPRRAIRTVMDGFTTLEHIINVAPIAEDVAALFAVTGAYYVPTMIIDSHVEPHYIQQSNVHEDPRARQFFPHAMLHAEIKQSSDWLMPHELPIADHAGVVKRIVRAGGKVALGGHGQLQGLGAHWELWAMAAAGLTPMEALATATVVPAQSLGLQDDIGSLEAGKLADLIVLNTNPLEDLRNTLDIAYVMKAGTLWQGETMDEVWPRQRKRPRFAWEEEAQ